MFLLALTIVGITVALLFHERSLAEQSLRQAEENLRLLTANLNEMVLAYDMNRKLVYGNPAVETLTGYSLADLGREQFIFWLPTGSVVCAIALTIADKNVGAPCGDPCWPAGADSRAAFCWPRSLPNQCGPRSVRGYQGFSQWIRATGST